MSDLTVLPVTVEHHREPLGIGEPAPRLSWVARTDVDGWRQTAYELEIEPADGPAWSSGRVDSDGSVLVPWGAPPLASRERRAVRVRVWGEGVGEPSAWSEDVVVEAGLLDPADWTATLVRPVLPADAGDEPAALLRREFVLDRPVVRARLYATAQGVYEAELNGAVVGDEVLAPGWTSYTHRLRYQTHDVTGLVHEGANAFGVHLADGWYTGFLGFTGKRDWYGDRTGAFAQLEVEHPDGSRTVVSTDDTWRSAPSPLTRAGLYNGETFDARRELPGWSQPAFDDSGWTPVEPGTLEVTTLVAPTGPPVRRTEILPVREISTSPSGRTLVDFGQNLVGRLRLSLPDAPAGTEVTVRHAEVLEHGELGTRPLRAADATEVIVLDGAGPRTWEPRFTFHGFRYAEVSGWPGELTADSLEAVVLHTDLRRTGTFSCSDADVTRLHENVVWGMRGNFLDVPTDCPQRDERLGWTGDLQVFAPTASFLYDTTGMLRSWLADLAAEQLTDHDGIVPMYVPYIPMLPIPLQADVGWGDAAVVVPWVLYQRTGDAGLLADQWESMTRWVEVFAARAGDGLDFPEGGFSFGDWLDTAAPPDNPAAARTAWQCVATAYLARSARTLAQAAEVLGRDGARFADLAERAAARFRAEYVTPTGRVAYPSQTAYALALEFDLLLPEQREHTGRLLAEQVLKDGFHIASGFLGTPLVTDALTNAGELATAYELLLQRENPSWLYPVTMGATTIWERWDSMLPDGTINPGDMTSFNHYALGAVADWLHRTVAGLAPAAPGYRRIRVAPRPGPGITSAAATHETPYGTASVSWTVDGAAFALQVVVPPNTTAEIALPDGSEPVEVGSGRHSFTRDVVVPPPVEKPALFFDAEAHQ
ncbi:glycoside hydrolase family 78 protein [Modestobacter marinus]|uniref:alpha-L-rhamnosidase n=1 Tax=Modestobacter marinus TaxID=477641 RepID=A0A846LMW5_9ACTN|nr:glycoside hydrolase family 78 protein [Modestobacter marinus]NIH68771.1 alpha-L-rhamnosidase [Modestobacter marinus]GGL59926.1 alpha-L-rhamnosidase [Modestobacter marinus]